MKFNDNINATAGDLVLQIPSIEECRAALEEHQLAFPGDYFTCHANGTTDQRRDWLIRRDALQGQLALAEKMGVRTSGPQPHAINKPGPKKGTPSPKRLPCSHHAARFRKKLRELETLEVGSKEYHAARKAMFTYRRNVEVAADQEGIPVPKLPEIPPMIRPDSRAKHRK